MDDLVPVLFFLCFLLWIVTLVGHGIWVVLAWFAREMFGSNRAAAQAQVLSLNPSATAQCINCHALLRTGAQYCGVCAAHQPTGKAAEALHELQGTMRTLERLHEAGAIDQVNFRVLKIKIEDERDRIIFPQGRASAARQPSLFDRMPARASTLESLKAESAAQSATTPPSFKTTTLEVSPADQIAPQFGAWAADSSEAAIEPPILKTPRKPFSQVLSSFMEESNIRWGEIVGGLLIVGCSTALVISLWAHI